MRDDGKCRAPHFCPDTQNTAASRKMAALVELLHEPKLAVQDLPRVAKLLDKGMIPCRRRASFPCTIVP